MKAKIKSKRYRYTITGSGEELLHLVEWAQIGLKSSESALAAAGQEEIDELHNRLFNLTLENPEIE